MTPIQGKLKVEERLAARLKNHDLNAIDATPVYRGLVARTPASTGEVNAGRPAEASVLRPLAARD